MRKRGMGERWERDGGEEGDERVSKKKTILWLQSWNKATAYMPCYAN